MKIKIYETVLCIIYGYINSNSRNKKILFFSHERREQRIVLGKLKCFYSVFLFLCLLLCFSFQFSPVIQDWLIDISTLTHLCQGYQEKTLTMLGSKCTWGTKGTQQWSLAKTEPQGHNHLVILETFQKKIILLKNMSDLSKVHQISSWNFVKHQLHCYVCSMTV